MDPARKSDRIGLPFTWDRFGTGPERIQTDPKLNLLFKGSILDPSGSVPDRFQDGPLLTEADPVRSGLERFQSGPV